MRIKTNLSDDGYVYNGTREEWLQEKVEYVVDDIYDDNFAIDFSMLTIADLIKSGIDVEEPEFKPEELPFG